MPNCSYYHDFGAQAQYGMVCIKCAEGYRGRALPNPNGFFKIAECEKFEQCASDGWQGAEGLSHTENAIFSCRKCAAAGMAVVAQVVPNRAPGLPKLNYIVKQNTLSVDCEPAGTGQATQNCALHYRVHPSQSVALDLGRPLTCAACQPGFRLDPASSACAPIPFCAEASWFNACSLCKPGYMFRLRGEVVDFTSCLASELLPNCFAGVHDGTAFTGCALCAKGFTLNYDMMCEPLSLPRCAQDKPGQ